MIKKIIALSNIGRFEEYVATGDVELRKLCLIYGGNGKGKSTITALCRSLKYNDPVIIKERVTLGSKDSPSAQIKFETDQAIFKDGSWSVGEPNIEIFDATFVNENVFSGETVEHDHKKNLYRFVVGEQGVSLTKKVEEIDGKIRIINSEIAKKELEIKNKIVGQMDLKEFIGLPKTDNIDELISQRESELSSAKKSKEIIEKSDLQKLSLPTIPDEFKLLLEKTIDTISAEAETKTKEHIKSCLNEKGEYWIQNGLGYMKDNKCPFCGQPLEDRNLIEAYQGYFNESYVNLKSEIKTQFATLDSLFSESALLYVQKFLTSNDLLVQFWTEYIPATYPSLDFDKIGIAWKTLRNEIQIALKKKINAPLEKLDLSEDFKKAFENYQSINKEIDVYNAQVEEINLLISKKKLKVGGSDIVLIEKETNRIKSCKARFEKKTAEMCNDYSSMNLDKIDLEKQKREAKSVLDTFTEEFFKKYQKNINEYLTKFGADFEIIETKTGYIGGRPSSSYRIKINKIAVDLGDAQTIGEACFRNVLSQGDKNSLAFAFFLAKLYQDPDIAKKIIVFDDPINSLDNARKLQTRTEIAKIAVISKQVIVMSHDSEFLRSVWDYVDKDNLNTLEIGRGEKGSNIIEWDILNETETPYVRDHKILSTYIANGKGQRDLRDIARCIRPVLEGYLRMKFPEEFSGEKMLGKCINLISLAEEGNNLFSMKEKLSELSDINEYSKQYHHDSNPDYLTVKITDEELKRYGERAIKLITQ